MKFTICIVTLLTAFSLYAKTDTREVDERLTNAVDVLRSMDQEPAGIPHNLLDKAYCVAVVPGLKKGGFIVAAKYGKGYVSCRKQNGTGWSDPATIIVEGGSFGFQIGAAETDVVMLVMNPKGMQHLFSSQFTLGGDATVAAGPVGRSVSADTSAFMAAEILTWSRAHGLFAGVALQGATLREDKDGNEALYGKPLSNREIIDGHMPVPSGARPFVDLLDKLSPKRS